MLLGLALVSPPADSMASKHAVDGSQVNRWVSREISHIAFLDLSKFASPVGKECQLPVQLFGSSGKFRSLLNHTVFINLLWRNDPDVWLACGLCAQAVQVLGERFLSVRSILWQVHNGWRSVGVCVGGGENW